MRRCIVLVPIGVVALSPVAVRANEATVSRPADLSIRPTGGARADLDARPDQERRATTAVAVRDVKLNRAEPIGGTDSATLMFDVYNKVDASVTDVVVSVSVLGTALPETPDLRRVVVRPFKIRLNEVLLAGYSAHYELRLRNLAADPDCVPRVEVIDARILTDAVLESSLAPE